MNFEKLTSSFKVCTNISTFHEVGWLASVVPFSFDPDSPLLQKLAGVWIFCRATCSSRPVWERTIMLSTRATAGGVISRAPRFTRLLRHSSTEEQNPYPISMSSSANEPSNWKYTSTTISTYVSYKMRDQ